MGDYAPIPAHRMFSRGGWTLAFALALFFINHTEYPAVSWRVLAVLGVIALGFLAAGFVDSLVEPCGRASDPRSTSGWTGALR